MATIKERRAKAAEKRKKRGLPPRKPDFTDKMPPKDAIIPDPNKNRRQGRGTYD